jgi:hypothetical protein
MANRKTLIVTTANERPLLDTWLPSLRTRSLYSGDVLVIDYDLSLVANYSLSHMPPITVVKADRVVHSCIPSDRIRMFHNALGHLKNEYDIIMVIDGNDVEFFKPLEPLFDMACDRICYVSEIIRNNEWITLNDVTDHAKIWEVIGPQFIANVGMFCGPSEQIYSALKYIAENLRFRSDFGYDQLLFNALIYYFEVPSARVPDIWNYDGRMPYTRQGEKCFSRESQEIAILHRIRSTDRPQFWALHKQ